MAQALWKALAVVVEAIAAAVLDRINRTGNDQANKQ